MRSADGDGGGYRPDQAKSALINGVVKQVHVHYSMVEMDTDQSPCFARTGSSRLAVALALLIYVIFVALSPNGQSAFFDLAGSHHSQEIAHVTRGAVDGQFASVKLAEADRSGATAAIGVKQQQRQQSHCITSAAKTSSVVAGLMRPYDALLPGITSSLPVVMLSPLARSNASSWIRTIILLI